MKSYFQNKIVQPLIGYLKQGLTPEKLAITLALSIAIGTIPLLGTVTVLCFIIAWAFRLNFPAMALITTAIYPLQLLGFIPFIKTGQWLFDAGTFPFTASEILSKFQTDFLALISEVWYANLLGLIVWGMIAIPATALIYYLSLPPLKRLHQLQNL